MAEKQAKPIGKVTHYFDQAQVAVIALAKSASLKVGDSIRFEHGDTNFTQEVGSLQVEHKDVKSVKAGEDFGLKVDQPIHENAQVFKA